MKTKSSLRRSLVLCASAILAASSAHAATLYWDGNDTNANANGGAGTWTTGGTNWDSLPFSGADTAWANGDLAVFGATAGTVTIGSGGVTVGGLTFITTSTAAYTLGGGTNGLNFSSGTNNITFAVHNGNAAASITGTVGGTDANLVLGTQNFTRTAALTFSGISSGGWTGATTIGQNTTLATTTTSGNINQALNSTSGVTLNGGAIQFNRATNAALNSISDTAAITVNGGGTFGATSADAGGASANETIGAVTLNSGQFNLNWTNNPSSGGNIILSGFTRSVDTSALTVSFGANGRFRNSAVATDTAADEIIGAWATTGGQNGIGAQTDYAVYSGGNGTLTARGIAASAETTWSTAHAATSNFTMSAIDSGTISGGSGRNVNTLRSLNNPVSVTSGSPDITLTGHTLAVDDVVTFSAGTMPTGLTAGTAYYVVSAATDTIQVSATKGGTAITPTSAGATVVAAGGIQVSSGNNLGAFGILNGSATTLNIRQDGGSGSVTLPTTDPGNLFVTAGAGSIAIAAPIVDNTGALTLVKGGTSTLTLSGTNTYTGGTVLNAGTLAIGNVNHIGGAGASLTINGTATLAPSAALNFSSGTLTVNQGALATISNTNTVTFATTTGAGTLAFSGAVAHNIGNASGLTGNLALLQPSGTQSVQFSSLNGNTAGSLLAFGGNANDSNQRSNFIFNGSSPLTFAANGRQVAILPSTNQNGGARWNTLENNSGTAANTWVIESDLINTGVRGGISLVLAGSNTGNNSFNGVIGNSSLNNNALWVAKNGTGKWILDGNNTFTGRLVASQGTISVDTFNNADTAGPLGMGQIQLGGTTRADGANGNGPFGDNSGTLQYTGGAVTTTRTVIIGDNQAANTGGGTIANDSTTGAITFSAAAFNNSAGAITATRTLTLGGSYTGGANEIQGVISNGTTSTGKINLTKNTAATWTLSGDNTYTGATAVSNGTLNMTGDNTLGSGTIGVSSSGIMSMTGTNTGSGLITISGSAGATLTISGDNSGMSGGVTLSTATGTVGNSPRLNINSATALGTGTLTFGGGAATDVVRIDNTGAGPVAVSTANAITMNRDFTFVGTEDLDLGTGTVTIGPVGLVGNRVITVGAKTLAFGGTIAEAAANQGITKAGAGTLLLNGTNTYTGTTNVNAGTLGGTGSIAGGVTVGTNGSIAPGASAGTLSIGGTLDISALANGGGTGKLMFELGPIASSDQIALTGTGSLAIGGDILDFTDFTFTALPGLQDGTYKLITSGNAFSGGLDTNPANLTGPVGSGTGTLQVTGNDIELVVSGVGSGAPEIAVEEPVSTDILSGGSRNFGTVTLGSVTSLTFTIRNTGTADLDLDGVPDLVAVSGDPDFTVTAQPSTDPVPASGTTTFTVQFAPTAAGIRNATLSIGNNDTTGSEDPFVINISGTGQTKYQAWAGGAAFDADANNDGISNGLAFLLGASTPSSAVSLPVPAENNGDLVLTFSCLSDANRGGATLAVQHSSDVGVGDGWVSSAVVTNSPGAPVNGVTLSVVPGSPTNTVTATIDDSQAVDGKLFGRLKAENP